MIYLQIFDETRKRNFLNSLSEFIEDAEKALKEDNQLKASKLWKKHLGSRYPEGNDEKVQNDSRYSAAILGGASTSKPWASE
ncbi:hypothetical protein GCM10008106_25170 [Mongoliitalea lutea]|uniref:Uncharacterized protein n=1 Tax=Mongoliitalea lutea TaxID=849756 RepID=A0A8J3G5Y7_9BACT|nr:hypothetical protein GCM10008106_25170 [Mongoliitalea lutea]